MDLALNLFHAREIELRGLTVGAGEAKNGNVDQTRSRTNGNGAAKIAEVGVLRAKGVGIDFNQNLL